jgi:hypothetical protein
MDCELELWIRGGLLATLPCQLPENDERLSPDADKQIRENLVKIEVLKLREIYRQQIERAGGYFEVYLKISSRLNRCEDEIIEEQPAHSL